MESITIYPKSKKQISLLKSLLAELKVRFEIGNSKDNSEHSEEEFYSKIDESILEAEKGKTKILTKDKQRDLFGL